MMPPKTNGFDEPLDEVVGDVPEREPSSRDLLPHGSPVERRRQADVRARDDVAADDADEVVDDGEHRQHDQRGEHARRHELLDRVGAERVERVDLLGDPHRAQLRGNARADASGDHETGEHGTELADHGRRNESADVDRRAEGLELHRRLQCQHHSRKESGEQHDTERLDADRVHLLNQIRAIERAGENETDRFPGEGEILLDGQDNALCPVI